MKMMELPTRSLVMVALCVSLGLITVLACKQLTPEEELLQARSRYEATLNNFIVTQVPLVAEIPEGEAIEGEGAEAEPAEATAPGDDSVGEVEAEGEEVLGEEVPVRQDVTVDLTIRHESDNELDGITVDFYMSDGSQEVANWKVWFDTGAVRADTPGVQFSHTFEDVDYQEGYGFAAEIRSPVPAAERSEYREFSDL